jgi:TolA-binding protein
VVLSVDPNKENRSFRVAAPFGEVTVHGTLFAITTADGGVVRTARGQVMVERGARQESVAAGQSLAVTNSKRGQLSADQIEDLQTAVTKPWLVAAATPMGFVRVSGTPKEARVELDGVDVGQAPLFVRCRAGQVGYRITTETSERRGEIAVSIGQTATLEYRMAHETAKSAPDGVAAKLAAALSAGRCADAEMLVKRRAVAAPKQADGLAAVADCFLGRGRIADALRLNLAIAARDPHGATGANALFESGRLYEQLGQIDEAARAFVAYRTTRPEGTLAGDALFRLCGLDFRRSRFDDALTCIAEYRRAYAMGRRVVESLYLEALVNKDVRHDYGRAAALFAEYLADGRGEQPEKAAYWRAFCLRHGDRAVFTDAISAYLSRFPAGEHAVELRGWLAQP